ncbi:MAG TPA: terminase large subunit [Terrisporobacter glycolicus]|uniref:terminase large subunit n=1 Tax=Terrisporobacter TaxID=1505652 RepID=UPI000E8A66B1|nr:MULTISPECIES: terminase TerL endonuclease subunit [Terrisporobacter]HBI91194.1 terminase large subunit [Terrisporobacter hibernicus]
MLKINYPLSYNPVLEYWYQIRDKKVVVSEKIYKVYKELNRLIHDIESEWEYNPKKANHAIEFIENYCKHSKGKMGGKPFIMELWQKALIAATFGIVHKIDGTRKYQEVMLIVARKNGKSTLASGVGLYLQIADGEPGSEVYAVATKKDQAKIIWLEAKRMVKKSPVLLRRIKPLVAEMVSDFNDSFFKPLGSDSDTLDGLNVHGALLDEIHAWKDKNLYDVIVDGTSARDEPLIFITSTAGTIRESIYDIKYDEAELVINGYDEKDGYKNEKMLPIIYELDKRKEWTDKDKWCKANPGLGTIKKEDQLEAKVNKAIANPLLVKNLLTKDFNVRDTSVEAWLTFEQLDNKAKFDIKELKPRYGIGGADLSSTTDLTNATVIFMIPDDNKIYVLQMYWLPEDLLEQRTKEDKIPYDIWSDLGLLRTTPGNKVHYKYVTDWFLEVQNELDIYISWVGYDSWSATYWVEEMRNKFGKECMEAVIQGKKTLSGPMQNLGADLGKKIINYNNNPILKWCLSNTSVDIDKNNNIQPAKGNSQRKRIDGTAGLLNAYVALERHQEEYINMI